MLCCPPVLLVPRLFADIGHNHQTLLHTLNWIVVLPTLLSITICLLESLPSAQSCFHAVLHASSLHNCSPPSGDVQHGQHSRRRQATSSICPSTNGYYALAVAVSSRPAQAIRADGPYLLLSLLDYPDHQHTIWPVAAAARCHTADTLAHLAVHGQPLRLGVPQHVQAAALVVPLVPADRVGELGQVERHLRHS